MIFFYRSLLLMGVLGISFLTMNSFETLNIKVHAAEQSNEPKNKNETNPLIEEWAGNYGGVPPFDKVKVEFFEPAMELAIAENLAEIEKIANNPAAPTFENTIAELERSGRTLSRILTIFTIWSGTLSSPDTREIEREMGPKLTALSDQITQHKALFKRIETVYNSPEKSKLTSEQQRLTWRYYTDFVRAGAKLNESDKKSFPK